ncbi:hypothetical protein GOV07_03445 [Candidatus Woesearchaeota archaeon]|nr:hypothetical protein [Candidatus Woesearchaeota archaeon]
MAERLTAIKASLIDLSEGPYIVKDGSAPNHVKTARGEISRANIIAAVVDKPAKTSILLDDGTARIEARSFDTDSLFENIMVGDVILLIGRPREYQNRRYLVAEIAKRLGSPKWLEFRKAELGRAQEPVQELQQKTPETEQEKETEQVREAVKEAKPVQEEVLENKADKLLAVIKTIDKGTGAAIEDVIAQSGDPTAEAVLTDLMAEGEIFEVKPGRVKVLE